MPGLLQFPYEPGTHVAIMADHSTIRELLQCQLVTSEQIDAAVTAYLANPKVGLYTIADSIIVDVAATVKQFGWDKWVLEDYTISARARRMAVRTAILLARPA
ncbi:hypothetical protein [Methylobacterium nodulans]|uniref:Uncharacterized protein n=1 Tax=Methylobacterium nodulans (strain LMG 21967 / CNCM I-2342 / ORS 2060) TaxID=460265 RepID=B8IQH2_METNO|nr:hypothetical protein [Methylobacterium nodulans]ACL60484.1 conserved hypothetical protein [Methylobacterium nodulans ORS 2060]